MPSNYQTVGVEADIAIMVGNVKDDAIDFIAKSVPCSYQLSSNRPQFGMVVWNNKNLKFDQQVIQQLIFVGVNAP